MLHFLFSPEPVSAAALIASTILPTRVHVHARERRYPPILVSISCFLQQGGGLRVWRRFYFCIKKKSIKDLKIYQSCCSRWSKQGVDLMSGGGSAPAEDRISMRGPITISHTSENNTLFFPSAGAHFPLHTRGGTAIILGRSAGTQTDAHSAEGKGGKVVPPLSKQQSTKEIGRASVAARRHVTGRPHTSLKMLFMKQLSVQHRVF